jgi:uncharacterized damage-inducible protein DinB
MPEAQRIADQIARVYSGDAWHGPSVRAALQGVDVRKATARPVRGAHTICELVLHLTAWTREITRRLRVGTAQDPADGDWPERTVSTGEEWKAVVAALDAANAELVSAVAALDDARLDRQIGDRRDPAMGSGVSHYVTLHGLAQHHTYHAGQISLLKHAQQQAKS